MDKRKLLVLLFIAGCSTTPTNNLINNTSNDINNISSNIQSIDNNLSKECKTSVVINSINNAKSQLESIKTRLKSISETCSLEIDNEKQKTTKWMVAFSSLLSLIIGYFIVKK